MSPDDVTPGEAARTEAARQVIILAFGMIGLIVMAWAQRQASDPDFMRTEKMRASKHAERVWARLAGWAWRQAERARLAYDQETA